MIGLIIKKVFGSKNDREVKRLRLKVAEINRIESELQNQPEEVLREKTATWKAELSQITDDAQLAARLDEIAPEPGEHATTAAR